MKEETKITGFDGESCQEEKERYQIIIKDLFEKKDICNEKMSAIIGAYKKEGSAVSLGLVCDTSLLETIKTVDAAEKAIFRVKKESILEALPNALISLLEDEAKNEDRD